MVDEKGSHLLADDFRPEAKHLCVVRLARTLSRVRVRHRCSDNAGNLVRRDRHTETSATDENRTLAFAGRHGAGDGRRHIGIVNGFRTEAAEVLDSQAPTLKVSCKALLELIAVVVGADGDERGGLVARGRVAMVLDLYRDV